MFPVRQALPLRRTWEGAALRIGESTFVRLPAELRALFRKLPNFGSDEVVGAFPESGPAKSGGVAGWQKDGYVGGKYEPIERTGYDDSGGSAARFFYTAKADADDRLGSKHPTVKPLDLMQYLVRLITPPKGLVLDPFAGTGTTGEAALREGMRAILIEREPEYIEDIRRRMRLAMSGPDERAREAAKAKHKDKPADHGPLFGPLGERTAGQHEQRLPEPSWDEMWKPKLQKTNPEFQE